MLDWLLASAIFWPVTVTTVSAAALGSLMLARKLLIRRRTNRNVSFVAEMKHRTRYGCGHVGPSSYRLLGFGKDLPPLPATLQMNLRDTCPKCQARTLSRLVAKCSLCGRAIMPEEPIALYRLSETEDGRKLDGTRFLDASVGCLDWECSLGGVHFAGHWTGHGIDEAFGNGQTLHDAV